MNEEQESRQQSGRGTSERLSRRAALRLGVGGALGIMLAACQSAAPASPTAQSSAPTAQSGTSTTASTPTTQTTAPTAQPTAAGSGQQSASQVIKLGLSAPITGNQAQYGEDFRKGFELALAQLNDANAVPGFTFEGVVEDSKSDPKEAANVAQKFASGDEVVAVIGEFSSTACLAAAPIYQKAQIIMMTPTASHPDITKTGDYIFRWTPIAEFEAKAVADWGTKDLGLTQVSLIGRNDDYGRVQNEFFAKFSQENGATVLSTDYINDGDKDFKPLITNLRAKNPEATMLATFQVETALLFQQAQEMGFKTTWLSGASLYNPQLLELAGDAANGLLLVSSFFPADPDEKVQAFVNAFKSKYNDEIPSKFSAHTYDAVLAIGDAVKRAGSADKAKIREALAATEGHQGVLGEVNISPDREITLNLRRLVVENGEFALWKES